MKKSILILLAIFAMACNVSAGERIVNGRRHNMVDYQTIENDLVVKGSSVTGSTLLTDVQAKSIPADGTIIYMSGRTTDGDGGEGMFGYDSSDLSSEVTVRLWGNHGNEMPDMPWPQRHDCLVSVKRMVMLFSNQAMRCGRTYYISSQD